MTFNNLPEFLYFFLYQVVIILLSSSLIISKTKILILLSLSISCTEKNSWSNFTPVIKNSYLKPAISYLIHTYIHNHHTNAYTPISRSQSYFSSQIHLTYNLTYINPITTLVYRAIRSRRIRLTTLRYKIWNFLI